MVLNMNLNGFLAGYRLSMSFFFLTFGAFLGLYEILLTKDFLGFLQTSPVYFVFQSTGIIESVGQTALINIPIPLFVAVIFLYTGVRLLHE